MDPLLSLRRLPCRNLTHLRNAASSARRGLGSLGLGASAAASSVRSTGTPKHTTAASISRRSAATPLPKRTP
ncbi:hypothetical protein AMTR_s00041p00015940 [Amborella trichopoda]|uniref:Uncharacterized protein n=1 Tax=Amborella trichopoda TaxID=13333 RepID=W1PYT6_AMBTC|nr:hypothetical protein AMTR_s00041p00015940 [Amborella trichopoda]